MSLAVRGWRAPAELCLGGEEGREPFLGTKIAEIFSSPVSLIRWSGYRRRVRDRSLPMSNDPKVPRAPITMEVIEQTLAERLDNEVGIVDLLLAEACKGRGHPELWDRLHEAAQRDDRLAELAFAY